MSDQTIVVRVKRGADYSIGLLYSDSNDATVNLTGYTISATIKRTPTDSTVLAVPTMNILDQGTNEGEYSFNLTKEQIDALPVDAATSHKRVSKFFALDIKIISPGGFDDIPVIGDLEIQP